jgi:RNA polymerase sigma-70 factor (ECF subfamily)
MAHPDSMAVTMRGSRALEAEFAENLRRNQAQLFAFIYSLVRDFADADDVFQQTSLILWKKYDQFIPSRSFVAWACGVARLEAAKFLRARDRRRGHFGNELSLLLIDAQERLEHERLEEQRDALAECMTKLHQHDQDLLLACYGGSASVPEVARDWNRLPQSVYNSLRRIRRAVFDCVQRKLAGEMTG